MRQRLLALIAVVFVPSLASAKDRIVGKAHGAVDGKTWHAALVSRTVANKDPTLDDVEQVVLRVEVGRSAPIERTIEGDQFDTSSKTGQRPFLWTFSVGGRSFLCVRLPWLGNYEQVSVESFELKPGELAKVLDVAISTSRGGECKAADEVNLQPNTDGSGMLLTKMWHHAGKTKDCTDSQEPDGKSVAIHFEWKNGCYARRPADNLADNTASGWETRCIPGVGLISAKAR